MRNDISSNPRRNYESYSKKSYHSRTDRREKEKGRSADREWALNRRRQKTHNWKDFKLKLIPVSVTVILIFLGFRVIYIQTVKGEEYLQKSITQLVEGKAGTDKAIVANRGTIVDRNMQNLAVSHTDYNMFLDVRKLTAINNPEKKEAELAKRKAEQDATVEAINQVFGMPEEELRSYLALDESTGLPQHDTNYLVIKRDISYIEKKAFTDWLDNKEEEWQKEYEDEKKKNPNAAKKKVLHVHFEDDSERVYVHGKLAAPVVGFIRGDKWGLEQRYDNFLTGAPGRTFRTYDEEGNIITERIEPISGDTIVTTLDYRLQEISENICEKYGKMFQSQNAAAIIMDPNTGEILSMAQYPNFNLNNPSDISKINNPDIFEGFSDLSPEDQARKLYSVWRNFNVTFTMEPGSIFKPVTVAAALEEGVISPSDTYYCPGYKIVSGWPEPIKCHNHAGHGTQTLEQALANSCNVAMMEIGAKLGREKFYDYQRQLGYGVRTGIDLPGEELGIVYSVNQLNTVELATSSFGQRFNCTPIQAIASFSAVINGGKYIRPHVVSQVLDNQGNLVMENQTIVERQVLSKEVSDYMRKTMEKVVSEGTGKSAAIAGYSIGGKTGTGEQGVKGTANYAYSISFIGYFPVEAPQYTVLVTAHRVPEEVYLSGMKSASTMFKELVSQVIEYEAIPSSNQESGLPGSLVMKNYVGKTLAESVADLNLMSVDYEIIGGSGGSVTSQFPVEGSRITNLSTIALTIGNTEGYELAAVPDLTGLPEDQALQLLTTAGFTPMIYKEIEEETQPAQDTGEAQNEPEEAEEAAKKVFRQSPGAGVKIPVGTQVKVILR